MAEQGSSLNCTWTFRAESVRNLSRLKHLGGRAPPNPSRVAYRLTPTVQSMWQPLSLCPTEAANCALKARREEEKSLGKQPFVTSEKDLDRWHDSCCPGTSGNTTELEAVARSDSELQEIITPAQVAALLQVHVKTVYRLAEEGVIPGNRIGRRWRFSRRDILRLVSNKQRKASMAGTLPGPGSRQRGGG